MSVLITSDNDKELFLVKTMIDYGMHSIDKDTKKRLEKSGVPMDVKITFNKISEDLVNRMKEQADELTQ